MTDLNNELNVETEVVEENTSVQRMQDIYPELKDATVKPLILTEENVIATNGKVNLICADAQASLTIGLQEGRQIKLVNVNQEDKASVGIEVDGKRYYPTVVLIDDDVKIQSQQVLEEKGIHLSNQISMSIVTLKRTQLQEDTSDDATNDVVEDLVID